MYGGLYYGLYAWVVEKPVPPLTLPPGTCLTAEVTVRLLARSAAVEHRVMATALALECRPLVTASVVACCCRIPQPELV